MKKRRIISIDVTSGSYDFFVEAIISFAKNRKGSYVCVANVHMTIEAYDNKEFAEVVNGADIVTPDGVPIAKMFKFLYGESQDRVAGMDLMPDLLKRAESEKTSVFFYGSTEEILALIREKISLKYPGLIISGMLSPPFRGLTQTERIGIEDRIKSSGADLIFVSLGCPRQEIWMKEMAGKFGGVMVGLGGAFPVFAGVQGRAPLWMRKLSLEWFFRLLKEPGRLWKRYFYTNTKFLFLAFFEIIKKRIVKKRNGNN